MRRVRAWAQSPTRKASGVVSEVEVPAGNALEPQITFVRKLYSTGLCETDSFAIYSVCVAIEGAFASAVFYLMSRGLAWFVTWLDRLLSTDNESFLGPLLRIVLLVGGDFTALTLLLTLFSTTVFAAVRSVLTMRST
jgi:hypothetical protein